MIVHCSYHTRISSRHFASGLLDGMMTSWHVVSNFVSSRLLWVTLSCVITCQGTFQLPLYDIFLHPLMVKYPNIFFSVVMSAIFFQPLFTSSVGKTHSHQPLRQWMATVLPGTHKKASFALCGLFLLFQESRSVFFTAKEGHLDDQECST